MNQQQANPFNPTDMNLLLESYNIANAEKERENVLLKSRVIELLRENEKLVEYINQLEKELGNKQ